MLQKTDSRGSIKMQRFYAVVHLKYCYILHCGCHILKLDAVGAFHKN